METSQNSVKGRVRYKVWSVKGCHCIWLGHRMSFNIRERGTSYCLIRSPYRPENFLNDDVNRSLRYPCSRSLFESRVTRLWYQKKKIKTTNWDRPIPCSSDKMNYYFYRLFPHFWRYHWENNYICSKYYHECTHSLYHFRLPSNNLTKDKNNWDSISNISFRLKTKNNPYWKKVGHI